MSIPVKPKKAVSVPVTPKKAASEPANRKKQLALILAILLLALGSVGAYFYFRTNPHVAKAKALQQKLAQSQNLSREERGELFRQVGEEFRKMPAGEREKLEKERRQAGMKMWKAWMDKYFSLSDEEKKAWLDEEIDRGEAMRKEWEKRRAERQANGQGGGQGGGRSQRALF